MRTTVSIEKTLLERAKKRAAQRGQTLGQYVEDAVRRDLTVPEPTAGAFGFRYSRAAQACATVSTPRRTVPSTTR